MYSNCVTSLRLNFVMSSAVFRLRRLLQFDCVNVTAPATTSVPCSGLMAASPFNSPYAKFGISQLLRMFNQQHITSKTVICIDGIEIEVDAETAAQIAEGKARVARMAAERLAKGQYRDYLGLFSSEDRLRQLQLTAPNIPDADFWSCLTYAWVSTNETSIKTWDWLRLFRDPRPGRHELMTEREQIA